MSSALVADVREGGSWSAAQTRKNAVIRAAIVSALFVVDRVPSRALLALGGALGMLAYFLLPSAKRRALLAAERNFSISEARRIVRRSFRRAGENLGISLLLRRKATRASDWVTVDAETERTLRDAGGAIAISAHLGAFELIPAVVNEIGLCSSVVVRESYDPALDPIVDAHRVARGVQVIHRGRAGAGLRSVRALRRGRLLGILPDIGGRVPSSRVRFLGATRSLPTGPARLGRSVGAPVLLVVLEPGEHRRFRLRAEILPILGRDHEMTQRVALRLEAAILRAPADWLWMAAPSEIADSFAGSVS